MLGPEGKTKIPKERVIAAAKEDKDRIVLEKLYEELS